MFMPRTLKAFYNEKFCDTYEYQGRGIFGMQDEAIEVEHTRQRAIKVQSSDMYVFRDANGINQLPANLISLHGVYYDIISWQYHGNKREEIILILEGDSRGN